MRVSAGIQIYNNQTHAGESFIVTGYPKTGEGCGIIHIEVGGKDYEVSADELREAIIRVSGKARS